jgi:hypothetical protein
MSKHTGPWITNGEVTAAREWLATERKTGTRARHAIEGMMYTAGRDPAQQLIERADYLARQTLRLASGPSQPTALSELNAIIKRAEEGDA